VTQLAVEHELREELAAAHRVLAAERLDGGFGASLSARQRGSAFLLSPPGLGFAEVTAAGLYRCGAAGTEDARGLSALFPEVHAALYRAQPATRCVFVGHPARAQALAQLEDGRLEVSTISGLRFYDDVAYLEAPSEQDREMAVRQLVAALGSRTVLLRADGLVALTAPTIALAVRKLYLLDRALNSQRLVAAARGRPRRVAGEVVGIAEGDSPRRLHQAELHFAALRRRLDRAPRGPT